MGQARLPRPSWALRCAAWLMLLACPALVARAQSQPQEPYRLTVGLNEVLLDVVVHDREGRTVTGLGESDFEVFEDKTPQRVMSFRASAGTAAVTLPAVSSTAELDRVAPNAAVAILVLDEINSGFEDQAFARYSLQRYLAAQGDRLREPTMLVAAGLQSTQMLRDFTTSRAEIVEALDHHLAAYPWHLRSGAWLGEQLSAAFATLTVLSEATEGHRGHKNLIWVGRGFPSLDLGRMPADEEGKLQTAMTACTNRMKDARMTLYAIDPAGLAVTPPAEDETGATLSDPFGGEANFNTMVQATGGQAFSGRNDVQELIRRSMDDGANFYTLTYKPAADVQSSLRFRRIHVRMKNPELVASAREGYYSEPAVAPAMKDSKGEYTRPVMFDLVAAAENSLPYDALPLKLAPLPSRPNSLRVEFDAARVPWSLDTPDAESATAMVLAQTQSADGKRLERTVASYTLHQPLPAEDSRKLAIDLLLPTLPGAAVVRVVVRLDTSGKIGAETLLLASDKHAGVSHRKQP